MIKLVYDVETLADRGFYREGIQKSIPSNHINIDTELWNYLTNLGSFKIKNEVQLSKETLYTITDRDMFIVVAQEPPKPSPSPTDLLNAQFMMEMAQKDLQIKDLETQLAQTFLDGAKKDVEIQNLQNDVANVLMQVALQGGK